MSESIDEAQAFVGARITEAFDELRARIAHLERELAASQKRTEAARRRARMLAKRLGRYLGGPLDGADCVEGSESEWV